MVKDPLISKGISPLIAAVMLVVFSVAIAGLLVPFGSDIINTVGRGSESQADDLSTASTKGLEITEVRYDGSNLSGSFQNIGDGNLTNFSVVVEGDTVKQTSIDSSLGSQQVETYYVDGVQGAEQVTVTAVNVPVNDEEPVTGGDQTETTRVNTYENANEDSGSGGGGLAGPTAVASDNVSQPETSETVKFIGSGSAAGDGSITSYDWDVDGDGGYEFSGASPNVTYSYSSSGSYDVELNVSDNNGLFDADNVTVDVDSGSGTGSRSYSAAHGSAPDCSTVSYNGSGTSSDPYNVSNDYQLQCIRNDLSASYSVVNNINASKTDQWNSGQGFKVITDSNSYIDKSPSAFTGSIDGNGHYIKGIYSNEDGNQAIKPYGNGIILDVKGSVQDLNLVNIYQEDFALVGTLANSVSGSVSNVTVLNSTVKADESGLGDEGVGGLVGTNTGTVEYSSFEGVVEVAPRSGDNVGGLIGTSFGTGNIVRYSYASATVRTTRIDRAGGLIGFSSGSSAEVRSNYAIGKVNGSSGVGGLVGSLSPAAESSYAAVNVSGRSSSGGLIGTNSDGSAASSYWDIPASGQGTGGGSAVGFGSVGGPAPVSNMTGIDAKSNMSQLDFQNTWEAVEASDNDATRDGYPILQDLSREQQLKAQGIYSP